MGNHGLISRASDRYRQVVHMNLRRKGWRAYANVTRSYYEYVVGASKLKARPLKLIFDPTNVCQLSCPLCPTGIGLLDRGKGHAELEMFRRLMEQVGDYVFFVDFYNWGEPLLSPHLEDFIRIARDYNVSSLVSTNLSLRLTDARIESLLTSGVSEIGIAVDGASDETYRTYRRKGNFDLVIENMRRLVEARRRLGQSHPLITWLYIVFGFNEHEIEKARRMAAEIGVDRLVLRPPFLDGDRYNLSEADSRAIVHWAPREQKFRAHVAKPPTQKRCGWHYTTVAINWDGSVTPCSTSFKKSDDFGTFGKSGQHAWFDVVNNPSFRAAREFMAGRSSKRSGVICERCPTPTIRHYHKLVYHQVAVITTVQLCEAVRRMIRIAIPQRRTRT